MCSLTKEEFCTRAPVFVGDILWEHLVLLQQDVDREKAALKNAPSNLSETSTEPVSLPSSSPHQLYSQPAPPAAASPHKTYHTLASYQQPASSPPLPSIKTEYPVPVTSYAQYHPATQYSHYQQSRPAVQPVYGHYPYYPADPMVTPASSYPALFPVSSQPAAAGQLSNQRHWQQQPGAGQHSYQV